MRDPHVRFCERHGGVISRAYSTALFIPGQIFFRWGLRPAALGHAGDAHFG
jgi:hypothetical protein